MSTSTATTAQLNVRIDRELRDAGTAALESRGLSPSEFVRALWRKAALRGKELEQVVSIATSLPEAESLGVESPTGSDILERGHVLYTECLDALGLEPETVAGSASEESFEELVSDALYEKWIERGLLDE